MDNHPIPQDVTNFEFRLIGDMTIKQFGYVAGGVILAWVTLAIPTFFLLKLVFAGVWILIGVILAFVPLEGRPADVMLIQFLKALLSPTQFLYQKTTLPSPPAEITPPVSPVQPDQEVALQKKEEQIITELDEAKKEEQQENTSAPVQSSAHAKVLDLQKELQDLARQKQELEQQLVTMHRSLSQQKTAVFTPSAAQPEVTQHVKKISPQMSKDIGIPLVPDVPNLITGVIKDPRGNVLQNMLIEIKDKDGNPVRAFKTNRLGQFASATPLPNGTYTIAFEDPVGKQSFDSVEISATGAILSPLEIFSVDAREKLRQELFGAKNMV